MDKSSGGVKRCWRHDKKSHRRQRRD